MDLVNAKGDAPLLPRLESLDVSRTCASGHGLSALLPHLTALNALNLSQTHVTGDELLAVSTLTQLRSLSLVSLLLNDRSFDVFRLLTRLKYLDFTNAHVSVRCMAQLSTLRKLEVLHLCPTTFKYREGPIDAYMSFMSNLTSLRLLNMSGVQLEGEGLAHVRGLTRMETLFLYQTAVRSRSLPHLAQLTRLHTLELGNCAMVSTDVLASLPALASLRSLDLSWLQIADPGSLCLLPRLQTVHKHPHIYMHTDSNTYSSTYIHTHTLTHP